MDIKSPEEDLWDMVTLHSTRLHNDLSCLLSHKITDNYSGPLFPPFMEEADMTEKTHLA